MIRRFYFSTLLIFVCLYCEASDIWIEAESFDNKGGWVLDQQFMDNMGSPYLLAHGMGTPVEDATTKFHINEDGIYYIYVRTYNWTSPWFKGNGAGKFNINVDGKETIKVLGNQGDKWMWQYAGNVKLKKGASTLSLHDLTGFDGRCDAIFLTTEKKHDPQLLSAKAFLSFKDSITGKKNEWTETKKYDVAVIGGGIAGICAAAAASRMGCKVALINDRPVLGGNNSSDVRVHLGGTIEIGRNKGLGRMIREFGQSRGGNAQPADVYEDAKKDSFIAAEKNIDLFSNFHAVSTKTDDFNIKSVTIRNIITGKDIIVEAETFADCTGDGTIGYLSGADYRIGRESKNEYEENFAPEKADSIVMGASVQWYSIDKKHPTSFPSFNYGIKFNSSNCEKVNMGEWTWETGMNMNQINDAEKIRDYGLMVIYSNWSFLKNNLKENNAFRNRSLEWVAYIAGKRESRRLMGDYILKEGDIEKDVFHEDGSFTTTWSIDLHFPDTTNTKEFPNKEFKSATVHHFIHPYAVPYRCLYSRNINNLFMAGRDISETHVALGTTRVMRTTGMMGEVVGIAASLCKKYKCFPRQIYWYHLNELKMWMEKGLGREGEVDNQHFNEPNKMLNKTEILK